MSYLWVLYLNRGNDLAIVLIHRFAVKQLFSGLQKYNNNTKQQGLLATFYG